MDVTKKNFKQILPEVEEAIKTASFVTIDGEFTGLNNGPPTNAYDSPAQYYDKIRKGAMDFLLIQFGLCAFKYNPQTKSYTNQAYNFYVFPTPANQSAPDTRFLCQTSSLDFLSQNGFDFNKLFRDGIPYLTKKDHEGLETKLKAQQESRKKSADGSPRGKIVIPPQFSNVVHDTCKKIKEFLNEDTSSDELELTDLNGFVRKLVYQEFEEMFQNENIVLESRMLPNKTMILVARKGQRKEDFENQRCQRENEELEDAIGFSTVINLLTKYGTCLVGHNMLLDLCHILNRFCIELPDDYIAFKSVVHCIFPTIFDTKFMCTMTPFKDLITNHALGPLLDTVQKEPFTFVNSEPSRPDCGYTLSDNKSHEAGYDAYITGLVFIALTNYLGSLSKPHVFPVEPKSLLLKKFCNKLFLMRLQDYPFINLVGTEPEPDRSHVFYVKFPLNWKTNDICKLFSSYGPINISWINDHSAFVALHKKEQKVNVIINLVHPKKSKNKIKTTEYSVFTFEQFENNSFVLPQSSVHDASNTPKRKRTTSNESQSGNSSKKQTRILDSNSPSEETLNGSKFKNFLIAAVKFLFCCIFTFSINPPKSTQDLVFFPFWLYASFVLSSLKISDNNNDNESLQKKNKYI